MIKREDIYSRTKEDLLNVLEIKGEACKKLAKELRITKKELKEKHNKILSLNHEIRQLKLRIKRLENE
jgi:hypothetical protein